MQRELCLPLLPRSMRTRAWQGWLRRHAALCRRLVALTLVPAIVAALIAHAGVDLVAMQACGALLEIAINGPGAEACVAAGSTPAIVDALKSHAGVANVAAGACGALRSLRRHRHWR